MSQLINHKTNFTAGEVSQDLLGRSDLSAYENGAMKLNNVFIDALGGAKRRSGLRYVDQIDDGKRLISFSFNTEQTYLFVLCSEKIKIYKNEVLFQQLTTSWTGDDVYQVSWVQSADTLLLTHPDYAPKRIVRQSDETFALTDWAFSSSNNQVWQPYEKFTDVTLSASGTNGNITLTASGNLFQDGHVGTRFRINGGEVSITAVTSATSATASVQKSLSSGSATSDWSEQAFSPVRGYPTTVGFYQGRLVIGGSRDLPNKLWFSKSFEIMNFDMGTGLDDEAIGFVLMSDQVNAIRGLMSGRHLQVFTTGSEWMVSGDPLTPQSIQLKRQTKIGSPLYRIVRPIDVSGATLFVSSNGREIREFLFEDLEQAYQAKNVSLLSSHLINRPLDMDYDSKRRLVYVVMSDGKMATLTNYRSEEVLAWSEQQTAGSFKSVCVLEENVYFLVQRGSAMYLESFDDDLYMDCTLTGSDETEAHTTWTGLNVLNGKTVQIKADGVLEPNQTVTNNAITLSVPVHSVEVGLPYTHEIVPLPPIASGGGGIVPVQSVRLVEARFRIVGTKSLQVDVGNGYTPLLVRHFNDELLMDEDDILSRTQDVYVKALGWVRDGVTPLWKIKSDVPESCQVVCVTTTMKVSG